MPCGSGKTIVSLYIENKYDCIIYISPLMDYAKQTIDRY